MVLQEFELQLQQEKESAQLWQRKYTELLQVKEENKVLKAQLQAALENVCIFELLKKKKKNCWNI